MSDAAAILGLGDRIRARREELGWSQQKLADAAGSRQQTIDSIEQGRTKFSRATPAILAALGMPQIDSPAVDHPAHYGGVDNPYEAIKVIRAWGLGFSLGNAVKYIARAGRKDPAKHIEDLKKARWYLDEEIRMLEAST